MRYIFFLRGETLDGLMLENQRGYLKIEIMLQFPKRCLIQIAMIIYKNDRNLKPTCTCMTSIKVYNQLKWASGHCSHTVVKQRKT